MNSAPEQHLPQAAKPHLAQLHSFAELVAKWNERVNLISRQDIERVFTKHILHSVAIASVVEFKPGTKVLDVGTGGGFPGIPLAICFPETEFYLIDSIGKKVAAVEDMAKTLGLKNVRTAQIRAENVPEKFDFITARAVTALPKFLSWIRGKFRPNSSNTIANGVLYLKGGDLEPEIENLLSKGATIYPMPKILPIAELEDKYVVHIPAKLI